MKTLTLFFFCLSLCCLPLTSKANSDDLTAFNTNVESLLMSRQFDALDAMAQDFRTTEARFPGSHLKLYEFYRSVGAFMGRSCGCSDDGTSLSFQQKETAIKQWLADKPQSLTAHVAMTDLLIGSAWSARTHKYSSEVTDDEWRLYGERMREAAQYLKGINPKDDPYIYTEMTEFIQGDPAARLLLDSIYTEAVRNYPRYFHIYALRADTLQPKWLGQPGELAAYTRSLLNVPGGEDGQVAYTYAASRLATQYWREKKNIYGDTGLTWPSVKDAYAVRERRYGLVNGDWNILLFFATAATDRQSARESLQHIGDHWSQSFWQDRANFDEVARWAMSQ